jgi:hypothetical protein
MKKLAAFAAVLVLVSAGALAFADSAKTAAAGTQTTWTGWITDESCGAKNANAEGKACALKCAKAGSKLVLYVDGEKKLVGLDNQQEAMKHVGTPVSVTGTLENGVIKVEKIEEKKG